MNFSQGAFRKKRRKVRYVNRACFPKEKQHTVTTEFTKNGRTMHMNFSFWPFLWFGLPGRLLCLLEAPERLPLGSG